MLEFVSVEDSRRLLSKITIDELDELVDCGVVVRFEKLG